MMGRGMRGPGQMGAGMMGPAMMRMMLVLMDTDGDGTVSLSEFQAAHERMFKALDANKDGPPGGPSIFPGPECEHAPRHETIAKR
jgi:hypothetical protein